MSDPIVYYTDTQYVEFFNINNASAWYKLLTINSTDGGLGYERTVFMAADIQIREMSALDSGVNKTNNTIRLKNADNSIVDYSNIVRIPDSGEVYSYTKKIRAYMDGAPELLVDGVRYYTDGHLATVGINVLAKNIGMTWDPNYNTGMVGGSNLFGYTSSNPLVATSVDTGPFMNDRANTYIGDMIEIQMSVSSDAHHGMVPGEVFTLAWDEI